MMLNVHHVLPVKKLGMTREGTRETLTGHGIKMLIMSPESGSFSLSDARLESLITLGCSVEANIRV